MRTNRNPGLIVTPSNTRGALQENWHLCLEPHTLDPAHGKAKGVLVGAESTVGLDAASCPRTSPEHEMPQCLVPCTCPQTLKIMADEHLPNTTHTSLVASTCLEYTGRGILKNVVLAWLSGHRTKPNTGSQHQTQYLRLSSVQRGLDKLWGFAIKNTLNTNYGYLGQHGYISRTLCYAVRAR